MVRFGAVVSVVSGPSIPAPGGGDGVGDAVSPCSPAGGGRGGLLALAFLPPIAPIFDFALEGVVWLVRGGGSRDSVFSLVLICGFLPPMNPIFEIGFWGIAFLELVAPPDAADSGSVSPSVAVSVDADERSFGWCSSGAGDAENDFFLVAIEGLLFIFSPVPKFFNCCF